MQHPVRALISLAILALCEGSGCYNAGGGHQCDCDETESSCGGTWTDQCCVPVESLDIGCSWGKPNPRYGCSGFPHNVTGTVGDHVKFAYSSTNVALVTDAAAYASCDTSGATVMADVVQKGSNLFTMYFNTPGTYHLTTTSLDSGYGGDGGPLCDAGVKVIIIIEGTATGDNTHTSTTIFAPSHHANPGEDDDWEAFGKGVFHDKAYDDDLHIACPSDQPYCLDRAKSEGSCYYSGEDFHIGHAVFCDVSEVQCCGYIGCSTGDHRGKHADGTSHGYYWYAPGYLSRGQCCHCLASCDLESQDNTTVCSYRDVTSADCQREPDAESFEMTTVGFLSCPVPEDSRDGAPANAFVRTAEVPTPQGADPEKEVGDAHRQAATSVWAAVLVAVAIAKHS